MVTGTIRSQIVDKRQRKPICTDFEDLIGGEIDVDELFRRLDAVRSSAVA